MRFSKRRRMALSNDQGMLVAPKTNTPAWSFPTPFIWIKNSVLILREASLSPSPRAPQTESISSIKIIAGLFSLAIWKRLFTNRSLSPIHFDTRSAADKDINMESASVATALARKDFPVPGGPYNKIPFQGVLFPVNK
eukprot:Lithocolla_globosa_v1_NODE_4800_length_1361_cov_23.837796.p2 type:complete len:138 gc:universal NODE_4800_length_1361_cov_23.837796:454-867(+)